MKLREYMKKNRWNCRNFSEEIGVSPATIFNIINRQRTPSLVTALKINRFTNYQVPLVELLSEVDVEKLK